MTMEQLKTPPIVVEVSHTLSKEQFNAIRQEAYLATMEGIEKARKDSELDSDLIYTRVGVRRFLDNCSEAYLDELIAKGLPTGRRLSDRKTCWSKHQLRSWLLENE
ncbi:hypothetical protein JFH69_12590 [Enterococcus faecalis]|uniref:hypothetical protein n=1 Tax=Enterococcus faecalis TaxID=1351 RepID=UPI0018E9088F|nr:hypothetical protein [Enterococcus faecalis]MBJ1770128.1 hypothetical protein [Enterococcus faecalis]HAP3943942.1 hypothetical protein [Enterococcus faecalis]